MEILANAVRFSNTVRFEEWKKEQIAKLRKGKYKLSKEDASIEDLKQIPIIDVIRALGILVTKQGDAYKGICPFPEHKESIESFVVYPSTNTVKCYGCGFFGDTIELVKKRNTIGFRGAIKYLKKTFNKEEKDERSNT